MKTATYKLTNGKTEMVDYDETAPCIVCGEPVGEASVGGTTICPACDCGKCRFCGVPLPIGVDREDTTRKIANHILWHKAHINLSRKEEIYEI